MKHLLLDFPSEILGHILSFSGLCAMPLPLWLCGCKALQQKLSSSVRSLELESQESTLPVRLPSFIGSLRALLSLSIDRSDFPLHLEEEAAHTIRMLNPSLKVLKLQVSNWKEILLATAPTSPLTAEADSKSAFSDPSRSSIRESAFKRFQSLTELELSKTGDAEVSWIKDLPPTLTSLTCGFQSQETPVEQVIAALPRSLAFVGVYSKPNLGGSVPSFIGAALGNFSSDWPLTNHLSLCPSVNTLRWIGESAALNCSEEMLTNLPPNITRFIGAACFRLSVKGRQYYSDVAMNVGILPDNVIKQMSLLETYNMRYTHWDRASIRQLPRYSLKQLGCVIDWTDIQADDWPPSLKTLMAAASPMKNRQTTALPIAFPPSLTELTLVEPFDSSLFALMPRTLRCLALQTEKFNFTDLKDISFPPFLTDLSLHGCVTLIFKDRSNSSKTELGDHSSVATSLATLNHPNHVSAPQQLQPKQSSLPPQNPQVLEIFASFPFHSLPAGLVLLAISRSQVPFSMVQYLPPCLHTLWCMLIQDADFNPEDPTLIKRVRVLAEEGRKMGVFDGDFYRDSSLPSPPPITRATIPALLPRTLTSLVLFSEPLEGLKDLPTRLKDLCLKTYQPAHPSFLYHIPHQRMTSLNAVLTEFDHPAEVSIRRAVKQVSFSLYSHMPPPNKFQALNTLPNPPKE